MVPTENNWHNITRDVSMSMCMQTFYHYHHLNIWDCKLINLKICFVQTHNPHLNSNPLPVQIWGAAANPAPPSGQQSE